MTLEHTMKIQNVMRLVQAEGWTMTKAEEDDQDNLVVTLKLPKSEIEEAQHQGMPGE